MLHSALRSYYMVDAILVLRILSVPRMSCTRSQGQREASLLCECKGMYTRDNLSYIGPIHMLVVVTSICIILIVAITSQERGRLRQLSVPLGSAWRPLAWWCYAARQRGMGQRWSKQVCPLENKGPRNALLKPTTHKAALQTHHDIISRIRCMAQCK